MTCRAGDSVLLRAADRNDVEYGPACFASILFTPCHIDVQPVVGTKMEFLLNNGVQACVGGKGMASTGRKTYFLTDSIVAITGQRSEEHVGRLSVIPRCFAIATSTYLTPPPLSGEGGLGFSPNIR